MRQFLGLLVLLTTVPLEVEAVIRTPERFAELYREAHASGTIENFRDLMCGQSDPSWYEYRARLHLEIKTIRAVPMTDDELTALGRDPATPGYKITIRYSEESRGLTDPSEAEFTLGREQDGSACQPVDHGTRRQ